MDLGLHVIGCLEILMAPKLHSLEVLLKYKLFTSDTCCLFLLDLQREGSAPLNQLEIDRLGLSRLIDVSLMFY